MAPTAVDGGAVCPPVPPVAPGVDVVARVDVVAALVVVAMRLSFELDSTTGSLDVNWFYCNS